MFWNVHSTTQAPTLAHVICFGFFQLLSLVAQHPRKRLWWEHRQQEGGWEKAEMGEGRLLPFSPWTFQSSHPPRPGLGLLRQGLAGGTGRRVKMFIALGWAGLPLSP